jgi:hypothetical protein
LLERVGACLLEDEERVELSKRRIFLKIILERMFGDVVISEEDVIYVVLSKAEKHVSYGGISWYHRMHKVRNEMSQKSRSLQPSSTLLIHISIISTIM